MNIYIYIYTYVKSWGLPMGIFSRKFRESAKERAKVKVHFEGVAQEALPKENFNHQRIR